MLIIGYGKLAKAILELVPRDTEIKVFSRTKEKVLEGLKGRSNMDWIDPRDFSHEKLVWLLLPAESVETFIKAHIEKFAEDTVFFLAATKVMSKDLAHLLNENQKIVPVKFIAQADQMKKDKCGMAALPKKYSNYKGEIDHFFQGSVDIVTAEEKDILYINRETTRKGIELVEELREELMLKEIPLPLIEQAAKQILPGVIHAYMEGNLGGFAKQIVKERREKNNESR